MNIYEVLLNIVMRCLPRYLKTKVGAYGWGHSMDSGRHGGVNAQGRAYSKENFGLHRWRH